MNWQGPYKISEYLNSVAQSPWKRPPERTGIYVVSEEPWDDLPTEASRILYAGQAAYLRYQIGRLTCDLLGFTGDDPSAEEAYEHKGGHLLWTQYCLPHRIEPSRLFLAWCSECICTACAETKLLEMMVTGPNRVRICAAHRPALDLRQNCRSTTPITRNSPKVVQRSARRTPCALSTKRSPRDQARMGMGLPPLCVRPCPID